MPSTERESEGIAQESQRLRLMPQARNSLLANKGASPPPHQQQLVLLLLLLLLFLSVFALLDLSQSFSLRSGDAVWISVSLPLSVQ